MDINLMRSIITVLSFILFIGIGWWAYNSRNRDHLQQFASMPLEDDHTPDPGLKLDLILRDKP